MNTNGLRVLIVDDEKNVREVFQAELQAEGYLVVTLDSGGGVLDHLQKSEYDVIVLDLSLPGLGGMEVLRQVKAADIAAEVIILTGNATLSTAIEAMKLGAYDYLRKPVDLDELETSIRNAGASRKIKQENVALKTRIQRQEADQELIAASPVMRNLLETVRKVAQTDFSVLVTGESGVGKELIARTLHRQSTREGGPFVPLNCGAFPESMIESELFGYEKGAFTGARARKLGLLELADGGTLFLDEIGDMPLTLQVKLLRAIETSQFFRLGGTREMTVNVRIISATNRDLRQKIEQGSFRSDLFYRITGLSLHVPPLRERREDIPLLIDHVKGRDPLFRKKRISPEAINVLMRYNWPGNVRELRNVLQRVLLLSPDDTVRPGDLPPDLGQYGSRRSGMLLDDVEREHIIGVLRMTGGHREQAAAILGIHPRTLRRKLAGYGVEE
jgi:DNA-binding NtrC family response regulator